MSAIKLPPAYYGGDPKRGAALGRTSWGLNDGPTREMVSLRRIHISADGYDSGNAYWGTPDDLWRAATQDGERELFFRADTREEAKAYVANLWPGARFYR